MKNEKLLNQLKELETSDFQGRKGDYPKSNIPDFIEVSTYNNCIELKAEFKNTEEYKAKKWLENHLEENLILNYKEIQTMQTGDYQDDWVAAIAIFKEED